VTVVFALLIGAGVAEVLLPLLSRQAARVSLPAAGERGGLQAARRATRVASRALLLILLTLYLPASTTFTAISTDGALTTRDRAAMAWVAHNTPATSRFMVLTDYGRWRGRGLGLGIDTAPGWGADRTSEWFPVLAARTSVATPQGYEFWHALKALGVPTELVIYENEGHAIQKPKHQRDILRRLVGWFDKYLQ